MLTNIEIADLPKYTLHIDLPFHTLKLMPEVIKVGVAVAETIQFLSRYLSAFAGNCQL